MAHKGQLLQEVIVMHDLCMAGDGISALRQLCTLVVMFELFLHGIWEFIFAVLLFLVESFVHNNISCIEY